MTSSWFETFFSGVATDCWRKCVTPELTLSEANFLVDAFGRAPPARVLDIACGNGRHSMELARRGYAVTGLDISMEYIDEARRTSQKAGLDIEWIRDDMRRLDRTREFDCALWFGYSFGYLEHEDTVAFLHALGDVLVPKSRFVLQAGAVAECLLPRFREREWYQIDDILFAEENRYRVESSCVETNYTFVRDGTAETRPGVQYIYTVGEIRRMLANVGIVTIELFSTVQKDPFRLGCDQLLLVAEKQ